MSLEHITEEKKLEFIHHAMEKVYFYIDSQLWTKPKLKQLRMWKENFKTLDEMYCAAKLLDRFVYYSEEDTIQLLKYGLNELFLKKHYHNAEMKSNFQVTNISLQELKQDFIKKTALLPLSEGNPSDSSHAIVRILSNEIGFPEENILNPQEINSEYLRKFKKILIVDDFVGTGEQIIDFWNYYDISIDNIKKKVYEFSQENPDIEVEYFCLVVTEEGYERFYSDELYHDKNLKIRYCEMLKKKFKVFGEKSVYFDENEIIGCKSVLEGLIVDKGFTLKGYRGLDYAIAFHHCIPDASLPLFYKNSDNWNYLIRSKKTDEHVQI